MIPYRDDNRAPIVPYATYAIIAINIVVFILLFTHPQAQQSAIRDYGAVPSHIMQLRHGTQPIAPYLTILTAMFMHGGIFHILWNMLFLYIFGNNIEYRLGHAGYAIFYLTAGYVATMAHAFLNQASMTPAIGASGAVSAILGAYMVLYPRARIHTLIFLLVIVYRVAIPAVLFIALWATIQVVSGINATLLGQGGGIAWFAHLGGFIFGMAAIKAWPAHKTLPSRKTHRASRKHPAPTTKGKA